MKTKLLLVLGGLLSLVPTAANAECLRGPDVVVNSGHGASIQFNEPVYQAKIFDPSRVVLNEISESGTDILLLTQIDPLTFPGIPSGNGQTTLLAETLNGCYTFRLSFSNGNQHVSVNADGSGSTLAARPTIEDIEPLDLDLLRTGLDNAISRVGSDNEFVQKTEQFLTLIDEGVGQRIAAQRLQIEWEHLSMLAESARFSSLEDTVSL